MFCENCGTKLEPGARTCPFCGASVPGGWRRSAGSPDESGFSAPAPSRDTVDPVWETASPAYSGGPEPPKKSRKGLFIGIAAIAVLCAAAAAFFLFPSNPKTQLRRAVEKSAAAYAEALEANPLIGSRGVENYERGQGLSLEITRVSDMLDSAFLDMDFLQGMGLRLSGEISRSSRRMAGSAVLFYQDEDLLHAQFGLEDTLGKLSIPELFDGQALAFDTTTLGEELARLGMTGTEELSFDFFGFLDSAETGEPDGKAFQDFLDAVEVSKDGRGNRAINGAQLSCDTYRVFIPKEALEDYLQAAAEIAANPYSSASVQWGTRISQDIELTVYVHDGYVSGVLWSGEIEGEACTCKLFLGGGNDYVDDLSLELRDESMAVLLSSSGSHAGRNGLWADSTTLRIQDNGLTIFTASSDFSYDENRSGGDNLTWTLSAGDFTLAAKGSAGTGDGILYVSLDDISVQAYGGIELLGLKAELQAGPYAGTHSVSGQRVLLSDMTPEELELWAVRIAENAQAWVRGLGDKIPALAILGLLY